MSNKLDVAIIGFGRFGQLWSSILKDDFNVKVFDSSRDVEAKAREIGVPLVALQEALQCNTIFYCVPISSFEQVIREHSEILAKLDGPRTLIDVLSVKLHPKEVFEKHLPKGVQAILTHPMFGPDSVRSNGLENQPIVMDRFRVSDLDFLFWKNYFISKQMQVIQMDADEHDRLAAQSQGVTHFVGRILGEFGLEPTAIDTLGAKKLQEIKTQVCHDTWQLFLDLQTYNPHTRAMRLKISDAQSKIFNQLLPNRIYKDRLVVGIQGGRGSFNEEAARYYLNRTPDVAFEFHYLHTTENVLRALHEGTVDRGQFAIHNSLGGIVTETVLATARYRFDIIEEFGIKIAHALMIAGDADFNEVDTIMTHPQVLKQCHTNLEMKYSKLKQTSGEGDLVDHAKVAELLGKGEMPKNIATMGSRTLASINNLKIVEDNLQDLDSNFTSFLWVQRPE
ncbi:MAG: prephenate dehydrogenase/arogenate dehydrogenase family protein [Candidatus Melainabacteria bacterium]|nr:prephenate dehydrogenase/arogenate dehydrogenase family protein [Candidatus Melainabacteria bacterium]